MLAQVTHANIRPLPDLQCAEGHLRALGAEVKIAESWRCGRFLWCEDESSQHPHPDTDRPALQRSAIANTICRTIEHGVAVTDAGLDGEDRAHAPARPEAEEHGPLGAGGWDGCVTTSTLRLLICRSWGIRHRCISRCRAPLREAGLCHHNLSGRHVDDRGITDPSHPAHHGPDSCGR